MSIFGGVDRPKLSRSRFYVQLPTLDRTFCGLKQELILRLPHMPGP